MELNTQSPVQTLKDANVLKLSSDPRITWRKSGPHADKQHEE